MDEHQSIWKHVRAVLLAPSVATLLIPAAVLYVTATVNFGWLLSSPLNLLPITVGLLLIGVGLFFLVWTVSLLARVGRGTLAPWDATKKLVVVGPYRHVRNPMISGVFFMLLGEAVLFGSVPLLGWFIIFVLTNAIYIPLSEEPGLARRFGEEHIRYKDHVRRWIPRLRPWDAASTIPRHESRDGECP